MSVTAVQLWLSELTVKWCGTASATGKTQQRDTHISVNSPGDSAQNERQLGQSGPNQV